nr:hypothetical protein OG999_24300 [Streptomyces sp. NBC_00886]
MRGVRGLGSAKSIALTDGSSIDANCRAGISARCAHITSGTRKLLMLGLAEQREAALDVRRAMSPTIGRAYSANSCAHAGSHVCP